MDYFEPNFINEALVVLDRYGERANVLAGGTLLGPRLREEAHAAGAIVNVKRIAPLSTIALDSDNLRIGSLATARTLATHPLVVSHAPLVAIAASAMGAPQLRSSATIGGNVLSGHDTADMAIALLAHDAHAIFVNQREGRYGLPVERMLAPGFAGLEPGTLLTDLVVPHVRARAGFRRMLTRQAFEMALVSAAVLVGGDATTTTDVRIALGGAARTPIRATAAETALTGAQLSDGAIAQAAHVASQVDAEPWDDDRASADYRRHLVEVLVMRALRDAVNGRRN